MRLLVQGHPAVGGRTEVTSRSVSVVYRQACLKKKKKSHDVDAEKRFFIFSKEILL